MVEDLLSSTLPAEVKHLVAERCEGNPLYVEEIVRMLIDDGVLRATESALWELAQPLDAVEVPRSIHALIAARLDSLPPVEKSIVQDAAVVGRVFWLGAVTALSDRSAAEVRDALGRLRVKEIITPREPPVFSGELEFAFRHVLIRDVAYEVLPKLGEPANAWTSLTGRRSAPATAPRRSPRWSARTTHSAGNRSPRAELGEPPDRELEAAASGWAIRAGERASRLLSGKEAFAVVRAALALARAADASKRMTAGWQAVAVAAGAAGRYARTSRWRIPGRALGGSGARPRPVTAAGCSSRSDTPGSRVGTTTRASISDATSIRAAREPFGDGQIWRERWRSSAATITGAEQPGKAGPSYDAASAWRSARATGGSRTRQPLGRDRAAPRRAIPRRARCDRGRLPHRARSRRPGTCSKRQHAAHACLMDYAPDYDRGWAILRHASISRQRSDAEIVGSWIMVVYRELRVRPGTARRDQAISGANLEIDRALSYPYALGVTRTGNSPW